YVGFFKQGYLLLITKEPNTDLKDLSRRFAKVFEQTYTRFLDLQKAEAQAREAQIEAALERVRSRTMAMQRSDELDETNMLILRQLESLDIPLSGTGIHICNSDKPESQAWMWDPFTGEMPKVSYNHTHDRLSAKIYEGWKKGETLYVEEVRGEKLKEHLEYISTLLPDPATYEDPMPEYVFHIVYFKYGFIVLVTPDHRPTEHPVFIRFAKVFEQTFTRFLDVQKAEAQAREATIEAALEKIRSRSLAMHKSDELKDVVAILFKKLKELDLVFDGGAAFHLFTEGSKDAVIWVASPLGEPTRVNLPYDEKTFENNPIILDVWHAKETGAHIQNKFYSFQEKNRYFDYVLKHNDFIAVPEPAREFILQADSYTANFIAEKNSLLGVNSWTRQQFSEADFEILKRVARVFEQAYIRFLDLQKAEAQAREAQIETALERVRSRSMGMQKSEELKEVIKIVYQQLTFLHINLDHAGFVVDYTPGGDWHFWIADEQDIPSKITHPYFESVWANQFNEAKEKGETFFATYLNFEEKNKFYNELLSYIPGLPEASKDFYLSCPGLAASNVLLEHVALYIENFSGIPYTDEENNILMRFGKVFQQTYRRFLDLQKAEAQAREATIEASLERVRARTMAMHSSDDVSAAIAVMFTELEKLGIENLRCGIANIRGNQTMEVWSVSNVADGKIVKGAGILDMNVHPLWRLINKQWKNKKEFIYYFLAGKEKEDYVNILNTTPNYLSQAIQDFPDMHFQGYIFGEGAIWTFSLQPHSEEHKQVMKKFTSVFSLTFRRYQDLKKAEAQAREATIEAALERVRARTMAMHNSEDVTSATETMFNELKKLGIDNLRCGIANIHPERTFDVFGVTNLAGGNTMSGFGFFGMDEHPIWQRWFESWQNKQELFTAYIAGQEKEKYFNNINNHSKYLPQRIIDFPDNFFQAYYFQQGSVWTYSLSEHNEAEKAIMKRFATGFSLTFRRYQDLKKAEAQAKEATIEAALEKVRGRAMAMHNSNDISVTASLVFTELRKLGINPLRCGVGLFTQQSRRGQLYSATSSANGDSLSLVGWVELSGHPVLQKIYDTWEKNEEYYPELSGHQLKSYYESLLSGLQVPSPYWESEQNQFGTFLPFSVGCLYAWSDAPYNDTEIKILKRFATIIDLTFRRYIELQKSESNARAAIKQAALDRVRAEIASMRTVNDLERITPLIWNELIILGIPFIRCGVFIMDESQRLIHTFLSTPDGKAIAAFHLPYDTPGKISLVLSHWHKNEKYIDHWDESEFTSFAHILVQQEALITAEQYLKTIPDGGFYLHFLPFLQGMLYVGNTIRLGDEEITLIQSIAGAFSTAYARYEDFSRLEVAKKQVDATLNELQVTQ
ncbi:MAG: hypothetical protein ABIR19_04440, partial [Ginsengibacter sp.]